MWGLNLKNPIINIIPRKYINTLTAYLFSFKTKKQIIWVIIYSIPKNKITINKLNNIILSKKIDSSKIEVYHLKKDTNGGTINDSMHVSEDGIIDNNFQDVTEKLYNERLNILEEND